LAFARNFLSANPLHWSAARTDFSTRGCPAAFEPQRQPVTPPYFLSEGSCCHAAPLPQSRANSLKTNIRLLTTVNSLSIDPFIQESISSADRKLAAIGKSKQSGRDRITSRVAMTAID
jgi:hypothetical protein